MIRQESSKTGDLDCVQSPCRHCRGSNTKTENKTMATETHRAPEDVLLLVCESALIRSDENASHSPERPRSSPINDEDNTSSWVTANWKDFIDLSPLYPPTSKYPGPWKKASYLAVRELPFGGAITIPLPKSADDISATIQRFYEVNNIPIASRTPLSHCPDQAACHIRAENSWDRWLGQKPRLMVFDTTEIENKGMDWEKYDVTEYSREGTVKLWYVSHQCRLIYVNAYS